MENRLVQNTWHPINHCGMWLEKSLCVSRGDQYIVFQQCSTIIRLCYIANSLLPLSFYIWVIFSGHGNRDMQVLYGYYVV